MGCCLRVLRLALAFYITPHRHNGVANKLIERTAVLKNNISHRAQVLVQMPDQFFRIRFLAQGCKTNDV